MCRAWVSQNNWHTKFRITQILYMMMVGNIAVEWKRKRASKNWLKAFFAWLLLIVFSTVCSFAFCARKILSFLAIFVLFHYWVIIHEGTHTSTFWLSFSGLLAKIRDSLRMFELVSLLLLCSLAHDQRFKLISHYTQRL